MNNPNLFSRTAYSFFNSILRVEDLINHALENKFTTVPIVEKNVMYSSMELYNQAIKNNLKPIIGLQIEYEGQRMVLFARNKKGYKDLMLISSQIKMKEELNKSIIDLDSNKDLVSVPIEQFEFITHKTNEDIETLKLFSEIGNKEINDKVTHLKTRDDFSEQQLEIVDQISESIFDAREEENLLDDSSVRNILPVYRDESGKSPKEILKDSLVSSMKERFGTSIPSEYEERIKYEYSVITKMGFESYFLIVSDIVRWSKSQGIFVGPGRGSAPGSLISYLLDITTIDPIENGLLFERFLNSERVTMPDIDIDFEDARRSEVINYIKERYGQDNVAQIITFSTLRAKMSIKDVARYYGVSATDANKITKPLSDTDSLEYSYEKNKTFRTIIDSDDLFLKVYKSAKLIEGLPRQHSTHAAGIIISDNPIRESVPVTRGYGDIQLTQYSMDYMEQNGLLKIDILGLRNLSFMKEILRTVEKNHNVKLDIDKIPLDDKQTFQLLAEGKTAGIFQLESPGMRSVLRKMKTNNFEDIVATTSLFRPGPQKQIPNYIKNKYSEDEIDYFDPKLKEILEPTHGIIVYQEQIMMIASIYSGFSLQKADILRRAIGKKKHTLIKSLKEDFVKGAIENGSNEQQANKIYDLVEKFSDYGFNRSHAYAYSIISYQLAYLKTRYPIEFTSALLSSVIGNVAKTSQYISEAKKMNVNILNPSINISSSNYLIKDKKIYTGFSIIKGVGESAARAIVEERENGPYKDFVDFVIRMQGKRVSTKTIELLIKAGAFDEFENRNTILDNLSKIETYIGIIKSEKDGELVFNKELAQTPIMNKVEASNYDKFEEETLGFTLTKSESDIDFEKLVQKTGKWISDVEEIQDKEYRLVGEIKSIREIKTKNGKEMAFLNISDGSGTISVTLWPGVYSKFVNVISVGKIIIVEGKMDLKYNKAIIAKNIIEVNNG